MHPFHRPGMFGAGATVAVLSTLVLSAGIGMQGTDSPRARQPVSASTSTVDRAITEHLSDLRKAAMAELDAAAAKPDLQLESKSLLLASTYEGGLVAGAPSSDAAPARSGSEVEDETVGREAGDAALASGEVVGMLLIAVAGVTEVSSPTGSVSTTKANVPPGTYQVRRDTTAIQLVNAAGDVLIEDEQTDSREYQELKRRAAWERDGVIFHELYFENLSPGGNRASGRFEETTLRRFGSFETWKRDMLGVAAMPGVGWAVTYHDPDSQTIDNWWIDRHDIGHPAGQRPILVLDVWEHAFSGYLRSTQREQYLEDFFSNVDWRAVEARLAGRQG